MSHSSPTPDLSQSTVESPADDNIGEVAFGSSAAYGSSMDDETSKSSKYRGTSDQSLPLDDQPDNPPGLIDAIGNFVHQRPLAVAAGAFLAGWLLAKSRGGREVEG